MGRNCVLYWVSVIVIIFLVLWAYFHEVFEIAFWRDSPTCGVNGTDVRPFYFGTTDVRCMQKVKRPRRSVLNPDLPERKFWSMTHRWVYYDGWYFELFYKPFMHRPAKGKYCSYEREAKPAGYSKLPVKCLRKCVKYYNKRFASAYSMWTHNCHHFANKVADVLCSYSTCPEWC